MVVTFHTATLATGRALPLTRTGLSPVGTRQLSWRTKGRHFEAPLIERRLRSFRKPHCGSIRIDETYIRIRGQWRYLYRAIDKHGVPSTFS